MQCVQRMMGWGAPRAGLVLALVFLAVPAAADAPPRPNIVLVTLDTTRADRLGLYGYGRNTSPNLDRLARDALVYDRAYSTSSWTLPAHASLFTGKFPSSHGARLDPKGSLVLAEGIAGPFSDGELRARGLASGEQTLAGILSGLGYETAGFVAGPWLKRLFSLGRGFSHYDDADVTDVAGRLAAQLTDAALAWLEAHASQRFFLFLNYYDPHFPYEDPDGMIREFLPAGSRVWPPQTTQEYVDAAYDGEVRYMDTHLGRLLDGMRALGLYDDAWIIVTADHGELLGEHGARGHGRTLYQEEVRIPFLVKSPRGAGATGRSQRPVQLTDVLPMLLEGLGVALPPGVAAGEARPPGIFAEVRPLVSRSDAGNWRAWIVGDRKLLWNNYGRHHLFDLAKDPSESHDLAAELPEARAALQAQLDAFVAGLPAPAETAAESGGEVVDDETRRALEALGYLE